MEHEKVNGYSKALLSGRRRRKDDKEGGKKISFPNVLSHFRIAWHTMSLPVFPFK